MAGQLAYGPRVIYDIASSFEATLCCVLKLQSTALKENYRVI